MTSACTSHQIGPLEQLKLYHSLILRVLTVRSKTVLLFCVHADELELRYKLHSSRDVEVLWSRVTNLADGRLHTVTIGRLADTVSVQVKTPSMIHTVAGDYNKRGVFWYRHCEPKSRRKSFVINSPDFPVKGPSYWRPIHPLVLRLQRNLVHRDVNTQLSFVTCFHNIMWYKLGRCSWTGNFEHWCVLTSSHLQQNMKWQTTIYTMKWR